MKKECDANGLEYELLMQESAKERFLREIKGNPMDFTKHLVILKQKRQSVSSTTEHAVAASDPHVAAPAPAPSEEPKVAAPAPTEGPVVGNPLAALASANGKAAIAGLAGFGTLTAPKILVQLRERLESLHPRVAPTPAPFALPKLTARPAAPRLLATQAPFRFPPPPSIRPLILQPVESL
jgi:hypothetical protein